MGGARIPKDVRDDIAMLKSAGVPTDVISRLTSVDISTVRKIVRAHLAAQKKDLDLLRTLSERNETNVEWACERNGIDFAREVLHRETGKNADDEPAHESLGSVDGLGEKLSVIADRLDKLTTILQSCAVNIQKTVDANADVIMKELIKANDTLGGIKMNTKKKGNPPWN